ncbi:DMT family transporter [Acidimangrovimonas pyrenivorans]|uniref:DMT family transporter n=1 Tax=Acidimangrovimonas pyrenivorans TaxID=2030798 RepID=A0ABV7ANQ4_9RHOB
MRVPAIGDNARGALYMNVAMAAFTFNDACMKAVTETLPIFQAALLRGAVTVAGLAAVARVMGGLRLRFGARESRLIGLRCVAEVTATIAFLTALAHMPLANLTAIMQSLPLAVTLAAALVLGEPVGWRRMAAIGLGFLGVLLIVRPGTAGFDHWSLLGLVAVAAVVLRDLVTRRLPASVPSVSVSFYSALGVTVLAALVSPFETWLRPTPAQIALLIAAAGFIIVGYLFVVMVMRVGDVGTVAPFRYTALLWAIVLGWLVFGQFPDPATLAGSAIVIATGLFTLYRERRRRRLAAAAQGPTSLRLR